MALHSDSSLFSLVSVILYLRALLKLILVNWLVPFHANLLLSSLREISICSAVYLASNSTTDSPINRLTFLNKDIHFISRNVSGEGEAGWLNTPDATLFSGRGKEGTASTEGGRNRGLLGIDYNKGSNDGKPLY